MSTDALENTWPWRVGRSIGRTIYACPPGSTPRNGDFVIGMMDSPEIAEEAVRAHNERLHLFDGSGVTDSDTRGDTP